jgi:hypothetical protein
VANNGAEAINYFDRALQHYRRSEPDSADATRCAARILSIMDSFATPWSARQAERFEHYLDVVSPMNGRAPARDVAPRALMAANTWVKVVKDDESRAERIRVHAEQASAAAAGPEMAPLRASAFLLLGNCDWAQPTSTRPATPLSERLPACETSNNRLLTAQALRRLTLALSRRLTESGEVALLDRTVATLREAASASDGEDRASVLFNMDNVLILARRHGPEASTEAIRDAKAAASENPFVMQEIERLGPIAASIDLVDEALYSGFTSLPASLAYRLYNHPWLQPQVSQDAAQALTVLLLPETITPSDGLFPLNDSNGEVAAELTTPCPACGASQCFTLPILTWLAAGERGAIELARHKARGNCVAPRAQRRCRRNPFSAWMKATLAFTASPTLTPSSRM